MSSYLAFFSNIPLFSCYSKYLERKEIDLKYGFYHALMWLKGQLPGISSHNPSQSDSSMLNLIENEESKENTGTKSTDVLSFPVVGFSNIGNSCYM